MRKILGRAKMNFEETNTRHRNIQNVLNNHFFSFSYDNFTAPLVPNYFMCGRKINNVNVDNGSTNFEESVMETR